MMKNLGKDKLLFLIACICMAMVSITILFMPVASERATDDNAISLYFSGIAFWIFILGGYSLIAIINVRRKRSITRDVIKGGTQKQHLPGVIRFFTNPWAMIFDILFILSLVAFIYYQLTTYIDGMLSYVLLAFMLFSFHMHCMLNGKNFNFIQK